MDVKSAAIQVLQQSGNELHAMGIDEKIMVATERALEYSDGGIAVATSGDILWMSKKGVANDPDR